MNGNGTAKFLLGALLIIATTVVGMLGTWQQEHNSATDAALLQQGGRISAVEAHYEEQAKQLDRIEVKIDQLLAR